MIDTGKITKGEIRDSIKKVIRAVKNKLSGDRDKIKEKYKKKVGIKKGDGKRR